MHVKTFSFTSLVLIILLSIVLVACTPKTESSAQPQPAKTQAPSTIDGTTLLNERCTACHSLDRVMSKHKTQDEWNKTVSRMVQKGAALSPEELNILVEYLAKTYGP